MWKPTVDDNGNGFAVIRFLPAAEGQELPWVNTSTTSSKATGQWYVEKSLTTMNQNDPVMNIIHVFGTVDMMRTRRPLVNRNVDYTMCLTF